MSWARGAGGGSLFDVFDGYIVYHDRGFYFKIKGVDVYRTWAFIKINMSSLFKLYINH